MNRASSHENQRGVQVTPSEVAFAYDGLIDRASLFCRIAHVKLAKQFVRKPLARRQGTVSPSKGELTFVGALANFLRVALVPIVLAHAKRMDRKCSG